MAMLLMTQLAAKCSLCQLSCHVITEVKEAQLHRKYLDKRTDLYYSN